MKWVALVFAVLNVSFSMYAFEHYDIGWLFSDLATASVAAFLFGVDT